MKDTNYELKDIASALHSIDISLGKIVKLKELYRDIEEIAEIIRCDADDSIKCKMISDVLTSSPHYFEEP